MSGEGFFLDGQFKDPKDCPKSERSGPMCPKCKVECESGYGFAGDYGLGSYSFCPECAAVYDFVPEPVGNE